MSNFNMRNSFFNDTKRDPILDMLDVNEPEQENINENILIAPINLTEFTLDDLSFLGEFMSEEHNREIFSPG